MKKFDLTEDLTDCYITNARIFNTKTCKFESTRALRISSRNECILMSDAKNIIKLLKKGDNIPTYIQAYGHKGGGVYYKKDKWEISRTINYVFFGCQKINKSLIFSLKLK